MYRKRILNEYVKKNLFHTDTNSILSPEVRMSVIVPMYNEEDRVARLILSLLKQKSRIQFEIVFIDNKSTDMSCREVKKCMRHSHHTIYLLSENKKGAAAARKTGTDWVITRFVRSRNSTDRHYLAFTDADCIVPENWIDTLYSTLDSCRKSCAVSGVYFARKKIDDLIYSKLGIPSYFNTIGYLAEKLDILFGQYRLRMPNSGVEIESFASGMGFIQKYSNDGNVLPREGFDLSERIRNSGYQTKHFYTPVISSQRRKVAEIMCLGDSYYTYEKDGRFIHVRKSTDELLSVALEKSPPVIWREYRRKLLVKVIKNCLLTPIYSRHISPEVLNTYRISQTQVEEICENNLDENRLESFMYRILHKKVVAYNGGKSYH